jgi:ER-bound oxygenase mpaB/B'/Rubber oxygenase, catalytic domain
MSVEATTPAPAGASALTLNKGRKWIAAELDRLDPEVDYARIWALTTIYYGDDTLVNLLYATGMPCFTQSPYGSELLIARSKKAKNRKHERAWDTLSHFWRWFEYGPEHLEAQRSIEMVNRVHGAMWKIVEEAFTNDDFIYTTAWLGTFLHRFRRFVGLPGFSEKQKIAAHHFWRGVVVKMRGPHGDVHGFPDSFDGMEAFVDEFESRDWGQTDTGRELGQYVIQQFNEAQLPKPLHSVGRQIVLTVQAPHIRALHRMGDPNPVAAFLIKRALQAKVWMAENVLPDPKLNTAEKARAKGDVADQHRDPRMVDASACPFHAGRKGEVGPAGR